MNPNHLRRALVSRNIRINYYAGMCDEVKHLVDLGHERIGYLCGQLEWSSMVTRFGAVKKAIKGAGLSLEKELVVECPQTWEGALAASRIF